MTEGPGRYSRAPGAHLRYRRLDDSRLLVVTAQTSGLAYNVVRLPLAAGVPVQLTHFDSEPSLLNAVAWSRDGKKLALTRRRFNTTDAIMISDFR